MRFHVLGDGDPLQVAEQGSPRIQGKKLRTSGACEHRMDGNRMAQRRDDGEAVGSRGE